MCAERSIHDDDANRGGVQLHLKVHRIKTRGIAKRAKRHQNHATDHPRYEHSNSFIH
jgi:hypothetical protein